MEFELVRANRLDWLQRVPVWVESFASRVLDDTLAGVDQMMDVLLRDMVNSWLCWVVVAGEPVGLVVLRPLLPGVREVHLLFKRSSWGRALAPVAEVLYRAFDADPDLRRVQSFAFADNAQLVGLARRVGAVVEGKLRQATMRDGKPVDMVAIGLLREDFLKAYGIIHGTRGSIGQYTSCPDNHQQ
jgi:RimJ/RimL family protein N-acetyltransferase